MRKFEEEHYKIENIKDHIYPWVKSELKDTLALNGKHFSEKDAPLTAAHLSSNTIRKWAQQRRNRCC